MTLASLVWLTAASTLFGSLPHIECRCPDGRVKLVCLLSLVDPSACCGTAGPCDQAARSSSGHGCCCRKQQASQKIAPTAPRDRLPAGTLHVKGCGCTRQLVPPALGVLACADASVGKSLDWTPVDLERVPVLVQLPSSPVILSHFDARHAPPPLDLVVVLHHILI